MDYMPQKLGTSRDQMQFFCLEEVIGQDHPVRVIDALYLHWISLL
jgi:hypothetical protein